MRTHLCCRKTRKQSGALLIEGAKLGSSVDRSFPLSTSGDSMLASSTGIGGAAGGTARACDFWGGLREDGGGDGDGNNPSDVRLGGDGERFVGLDNDEYDDSDGGAGDFGGGFDPDDAFDQPDGVQVRRIHAHIHIHYTQYK